MHYITLFVIEKDKIRCLEPSLKLYDHFEIGRFFGIELAVLAETLSYEMILCFYTSNNAFCISANDP